MQNKQTEITMKEFAIQNIPKQTKDEIKKCMQKLNDGKMLLVVLDNDRGVL